MHYKVFISYRRNGGTMPANVVKLTIEQNLPDYPVFMDVHEQDSGRFTETIDAAISNAEFFILIVSPQCFNENREFDYFYHEIDLALKLNKKIIPITFDESLSRKTLPARFSDSNLHLFQQIKYNHAYAAAFSEKLINFLSKDGKKTFSFKAWTKKKICSMLVFVVWTISFISGYIYQSYADRYLDDELKEYLVIRHRRMINETQIAYDFQDHTLVMDIRSASIKSVPHNVDDESIKKSEMKEMGVFSALLSLSTRHIKNPNKIKGKQAAFALATVVVVYSGCVVYRMIHKPEYSPQMELYLQKPYNWVKDVIPLLPTERNQLSPS